MQHVKGHKKVKTFCANHFVRTQNVLTILLGNELNYDL